MILKAIDEIKDTTGTSYAQLCVEVGVSYPSLMRWRERYGRGVAPISFPGPHKVEPMDLERIRSELGELEHGRKRTAGTGELYERYRNQISRRQLRLLVDQARQACWNKEKGGRQHIYWHEPRLIWAVDDIHVGHCDGVKVWSNQIRDLSSRYQFNPKLGLGHVLVGDEVAMRLDRLFEAHGAPLVLKRDNGSNLDCKVVDQVLQSHGVIPLNSPPYYPKYNGGVERGQREFREALAAVGYADHLALDERIVRAELATAKLNEQYRRVLHGHTSAWSFETGKQRQREYTLRHRKEAFEEMIVMATVALTETGSHKPMSPQAAWRLAVQTWLQFHGMITISQERKLLPIFP